MLEKAIATLVNSTRKPLSRAAALSRKENWLAEAFRDNYSDHFKLESYEEVLEQVERYAKQLQHLYYDDELENVAKQIWQELESDTYLDYEERNKDIDEEAAVTPSLMTGRRHR